MYTNFDTLYKNNIPSTTITVSFTQPRGGGV